MGDATIPNRGRLASILLARKPRFTASRNDTTATAESEGGYAMAVSFWVAEPPELSLFSIHCTKPPQHTEHCYFSVSPHVVGADGPFVLFRAAFNGSGTREYFLYKAGAHPSLERIPSPGDDLREVRELGILGHGDGHYLLAVLRDAPSSDDDNYQLLIYSSERKSWSTRTLHNPCPGVDRVIPDKVITLGQGGLVGWVDLSHGLLVCDLLLLQDPDPTGGCGGGVSFFIPLPEPLPGNMYKQKYPIPPTKKIRKHPSAVEPSGSASWFRDITCVNGVLKFIEMENQPAPPENKDNIIYDSDLIISLKRKVVDGNSKQQLSSFRDAWRAVTWSRKVSSSWSNFWRQTCAAHVADIKGQQLTFRDLYSAFPILSPEDGDDILYLRSLVETSHRDGWVAAVDIGNKALKAIGQYYLPDDFYYAHGYDPEHPFRACTLSRHMDMTPGIEVSACRKTTEASSSANHPSKTSIRVGSCKPRTTIQSLLELSEKIKRARNPPESIIQNDHISQVHPVQNNLPQQQCFNKWDAPCYPPGHSLWPHRNNLPLQQCVNKPDGPCGPGYASLAPIHGHHNYQPLWRQPPPSKQQLMSSSEFGPHEAPQPCFNNCNGASYHGYSQQLSAPNSSAYGAHTGYGNYQQQWQQLPPTMELPIGATLQHPPPPVQHQATPREVQESEASK